MPNPAKRMAASGSKETNIGDPEEMPLGLESEAAQEGKLIVRLKGVEELPGTMVGGVKVQVAPVGKELFRQDSVNACFA